MQYSLSSTAIVDHAEKDILQLFRKTQHSLDRFTCDWSINK